MGDWIAVLRGSMKAGGQILVIFYLLQGQVKTSTLAGLGHS